MLKNLSLVCSLVSSVLLTNCSDKSQVSENPTLLTGRSAIVASRAKSECDSGIKAFEASLHKLLRNDCIGCHDLPANPQVSAPPHSVENAHTSYYYNISYVDWTNIENSKIMRRVAEAHWKGKPGGTSKTTEDDMRKVLKAWWEGGQKDCPSLGKFVSKPTTLAGDFSNWKRVPVSLPNESDALKDAKISVEIKVENNSYYLRKPLIEGAKLPVRLKRIYAILNGKGFDTPLDLVQATVEPEGSGSTSVLSAYTTAIPVETTQTDVLSFGFDDLKAVPKFECKNFEGFQKHVLPELKLRSCYNCHGGNGKTGEMVAKTRLNMDVPEKDLCRALLTRGNGQYVVESPLIAYPLSGVNGHPPVIPHSGEVLPSWIEWVRSEKIHTF